MASVCNLRRRAMVERTVTAEGVLSTYAPPAMVFLQDLHFQIPVTWRLMASLPQNVQWYLLCWVVSIFFTSLRRVEP